MMAYAKNRDRSVKSTCVALLSVMFGVCWLTGCGSPAPVEVKGDAEEAASAVTDALTAWKDGKKTEDLKDLDPQVIVRDEDWEGGATLKSFEVKPDATKEGGNWRVYALITVTGPGQPAGAKSVSYSVTVDPLISVLRMDNIE